MERSIPNKYYKEEVKRIEHINKNKQTDKAVELAGTVCRGRNNVTKKTWDEFIRRGLRERRVCKNLAKRLVSLEVI